MFAEADSLAVAAVAPAEVDTVAVAVEAPAEADPAAVSAEVEADTPAVAVTPVSADTADVASIFFVSRQSSAA